MVDNNGWWTAMDSGQQRTTTVTNDNCNGNDNKWQLCRQQHCRAICVRELYDNGVKKRKKKFFYFLFFYSFSSSRAATRATHYMTARLKTHKNAQPKRKPQNPCTRKTNVCGVTSYGADLVLQSNLVCVCVRTPKT
jgi:hypothetical protein